MSPGPERPPARFHFELRPEGIDFSERAPLVHRMRAPVAADPDAVFATIADAASWPAWFPGLTHGWGEGDRRRVRLAGGTGFDERVLVADGRRYAWCVERSTSPLARALVEVWDVHPVAATGDARIRSWVTWTFAMDPRPGARLLLAAQPLVMSGLHRRAMARLAETVTASVD